MNFIKFISTICLSLFLISCAERPPTPVINSRSDSVDKFSLAYVQSKIIKGSSDKSDVIKLLGTPNLITSKKDGKELFIWDKRSFEQESAAGRGASVRIENERTITIAITFDGAGIVEDISYRATSF